MSEYFTRVRRRTVGGECFDGDGNFGFKGPPTREPRDKQRVIVHNHVAHTVTQIPGMHGFRAWTQLKDRKCKVCKCGWGGVRHYRYGPVSIYAGGAWGYNASERKKPKLQTIHAAPRGWA